jgi:3-methyl-2-oxobutanoate hydroxymethyltransferase
VLELVPAELAREITTRLRIPTIGIGAGPHCDGQVQVWHDLMGLYTDFVPRHARRYLTLADSIGDALRRYMADVNKGVFPTMDNTSSMSEQELQEAIRALDKRA